MWVYNDDTEKLEKRDITYVPALFKVRTALAPPAPPLPLSVARCSAHSPHSPRPRSRTSFRSRTATGGGHASHRLFWTPPPHNTHTASAPRPSAQIFDEILVNAADHKQRDETMTFIKIKIDAESGEISVMNDGKGLPVTIHKVRRRG